MKNHSLFGLAPEINPFFLIDKLLNPYVYSEDITFKNKRIMVSWTARAEKEMQKHSAPLIVEMQLYFSCVVKKRVLFSRQAQFSTTAVNDKLNIAFHPVQAASCDPIEFAKNFPAQREFDSVAAKKMHPNELILDFKNNAWHGVFNI